MSGSRASASAAPFGGRCIPETNGRRGALTPGRVVATLLGLALMCGGVLLGRDSVALGPAMLTAGALFVLFGFAFSMVSQVELGAPLLVKVTVAAKERRDRLKQFVDDSRGLLVACAADLCLDPDAALRAVESTVSDVLAGWRGTDLGALRVYLLCVLVRESEFEVRTRTVPPGREPFLRLTLREREVLLLCDRAGLNDAAVARIVGVAEADVAGIRDRALAALPAPEGAP